MADPRELLNRLGELGAIPACPSCGRNDWSAPDLVVIHRGSGASEAQVTGEGMTTLMLLCDWCGFVRLHATQKIEP